MYQTLLVAPTLRVSSPLSPLAVPSICISPAADVCAHPDTEAYYPEDAMSPRSTHLLPPPALSPLRRSLSSKAADKKGLDQSTFDHLLVANRERARRPVNAGDRFRREVVVKAHHSKQIERRALFLSKITAPPSPTSAETAVTPPESPAVFHFTLPSPGLASPLELFENVKARDSWVEHVDYNNNHAKRVPSSRLPSLDQITARLRPSVVAPTTAVPTVVVQAPVAVAPVDVIKPRVSRLPDSIRISARVRSASPPTPTAPAMIAPLNVVKGDRQDEVKPCASRLPDSIRTFTRVRAASPPNPTPTPAHVPTSPAPSQLIIPRSPPKSIKPVLVPQSIPALRINHAPCSTAELVPVPVMSWRERALASPVGVTTPRKDVSMGSWKEPQSQQYKENPHPQHKEPLIQSGSWRDGQGQLTSWREVPIKKEVVRDVPPISPRTVLPLPIGVKPLSRPVTAPVPAPALVPTTPALVPVPTHPTQARTLNMNVASPDGLATSRRSALWRVQRDAAGAVKLSESERRAVQGRNMVDKLKRRTSAPAELQGTMRRGAPVGGF